MWRQSHTRAVRGPVHFSYGAAMNATVSHYAAAQRHRITVAEARAMQAASVFGMDADFELIDGELIFMASDGGRTISWNAAIGRWLYAGLAIREDLVIVPDKTLVLSEHHGPKPDFYIYPGAIENPEDVRGPDTLLVIEVADSTRDEDLGPKAALYAEFGVRDYWVFDCKHRLVHVHRPVDGKFAVQKIPAQDVATAALLPLRLRLNDLPRLL